MRRGKFTTVSMTLQQQVNTVKKCEKWKKNKYHRIYNRWHMQARNRNSPCFQNIQLEYKEILKENKDFISADDNVFTIPLT